METANEARGQQYYISLRAPSNTGDIYSTQKGKKTINTDDRPIGNNQRIEEKSLPSEQIVSITDLTTESVDGASL